MNNQILVVDDDRTTRNVIAGLLGRFYDVVMAASGEEALTLAAQRPPAVVLLDIMMPGIDGYETCRRLKTEFAGENIQVIMVSAASSGEEQSRAFELGADPTWSNRSIRTFSAPRSARNYGFARRFTG